MILCFVSGASLTESSSGFTLLGMKEKTAPTVVLPGCWREPGQPIGRDGNLERHC